LTTCQDFGPSNSIHYAGTTFGRHLLLNPRIGDEENIRTSRQSTLITLEPSFLLIFEAFRFVFNLPSRILDVFYPNMVVDALRIEPQLRSIDAVETILTLLTKHFDTTPKEKLVKLAKRITILNHRKGEVVFYHGDRADK
jgi:hypothetical protein